MATDMIKLQCSDGQEFIISKDVILMSETIKNMMEDLGNLSGTEDITIPLPNVRGEIMKKVLEFCQYHFENPHPPLTEEEKEEKEKKKTYTDMIKWDIDFCNVEKSTLFEYILAANYLDIKILLDAACKTVCKMIVGKTPEQIRKEFNIKNDFTPEEEEEIRKENAWL